MTKILITGGVGFLGGRLSKKISNSCIVSVSSRSILDNSVLKLHGIESSILHKDLLISDRFPSVDVVIHLAALNEWDCIRYPSEAIKVNIDDTRIILENALKVGAKKFIYFSTAHVYKSPLINEVSEDIITNPTHPYAITHKAAEDYVLAAHLQNKLQSVVIRLSNSFGPPTVPNVNRWTLLANDLCKQAIETKKLKLLSNGCQFRDFVTLTDVENCIDKIVASENNFNKGIYNLGSGIGMRVIDLAKLITEVYEELFHEKIEIELPENAAETTEPELNFSIKKILSEGFTPVNNFKKEIRDLLVFCNNNFRYNG